MIKRILVGISGTPYFDSAARTALDIAQRHGAEITGVTLIDHQSLRDIGPVPIGAGQEAKELREHRLELTKENIEVSIAKFTTLCTESEVTHDVLREDRQSPCDYLLSQARYHDLTVLGLKGIFEYGAPGMAGEDGGLLLINLLSGGLRPIIAVPEDYRAVKRVLVAYSGSIESASTFKRFFQLQAFGDVQVRFISVGEAERCQRLLRHASDYCKAYGIALETSHSQGSSQDLILKEATAWKADMIVMGNSAKSLLLRRVLGETALNAIRNSELPLFLAQ